MGPGLELRREPMFERSYRRNVANVYHYALGVLSDPGDAEEVTHTTFRNAQRECLRLGRSAPDLNSLLAIAHDVCRMRGGHQRLVEAELAGQGVELSACEEAERAIGRSADRRLPRGERRRLRRHLRSCGDCRAFARLQHARRDALAALAAMPLPASLEPAPEPTRLPLHAAARLGAAAATAALVLALVASGGVPSPASFIGKHNGPEAEAGVEDREPDRKFRQRPASSR